MFRSEAGEKRLPRFIFRRDPEIKDNLVVWGHLDQSCTDETLHVVVGGHAVSCADPAISDEGITGFWQPISPALVASIAIFIF